MSMRMERPFPIQVKTMDSSERMEVLITFQNPISDDGKEGVLEVMTTFSKLGAVGGLAGASCDPGRSSLILETSNITEQKSHWVFKDVRIDPASLFVLSNMIHYLHLEEVPVKRVDILWPLIGQLADPMVIQFPEQWPRLSFPLNIGELLDDIDVNIEFCEPQKEELVERIVDTMSIWLLATHRGAYADDAFDPSRTAVFLGPDVMDTSSDRITWFIEVLRCNENALDGLLNLLEWVHQNISPLGSVEIGP